MLGAVLYIPPENSIYSIEDPFADIQKFLNLNSNKCLHVCIFGDLNSGTGCLLDFIHADEDFLCNQNMTDIYNEYESEMFMFEDAPNISLNRKNDDKSTNNYGHRLIDFLKMNNLYILKGRVKGDKCGNTTYVHNPVTLKFNFMNPVKEYENQRRVPKIKLWDKTKTNDFVNNIDHDVIETIYNSLSSLEQNGHFNQETANATVNMISELFLNASKPAFGTYHNNNINENSGMNTKENKLPTWFGSQCTKARRNFHKARYLYKIRKTDINKEHLKQTSKIYKRTLNKYNNKSKSKTIKQLRNLKHSDPSKFWKILRGNN
ncbi:hypothetical protein ACF0H5_006578 [Mactra antiquata]